MIADPYIYRFILRFLFLILITPVLCAAQELKGSKVLEPIPAEQQPRLIVRLKEQIRNERDRDWTSMFALLPKQHTQEPDLTLEEFVLRQNRWKTRSLYVLDFVPSATVENESIDADYVIFGCARSKDGWFSKWTDASIGVAFENGDWFIDQVHWLVPSLHTEPRKCKPDKKNDPLRDPN